MGTTRILIADHDANTRQALAAYLCAHHYEVLHAVDSSQALAIARREHPHLILLDVGLPGGDGHGFVPHLKASPSCAGVPIIVLSGVGTPCTVKTALQEGAAGFLQKPADPATLLATIRRALEESREAAGQTGHRTYGDGRRTQPLALVVDDDEGVRLVIRASLEAADFVVEEAEDGREALAAFQRLAPDLMLLDVLMPHMNGFATCLAMRALPNAAQIPIVMVTGLDDVESIKRAYEVGATDFITKPIDRMMLCQRVRYILRAGQTLQAFDRSERQLRGLIRERSESVVDLHDDIIQCLYAIGLGLEEGRRLIQEDPGKAVMQLCAAVNGLNGVIGQVRHHIVDLQPAMMQNEPADFSPPPETFQRIH